jgi:outer membrane autotransporter protein
MHKRDTRVYVIDDKFTAWISGFSQLAHVSEHSQSPSFNYYSGSALAGLDYLGKNNNFLGGSLGYAYTHYTDKSSSGKGSINSYFANLYGSVFIKSFYFSPALWGIYNQADNVRNISFSDFSDKAHADINAWQLVPHLEIGYNTSFSWGSVIPFSLCDWAISWQGGYTEHGASPFNTTQSSHNSSMVRSETGVKFVECWNVSWGAFILKEKASYVFEKPFSIGKVNASFVGTPGSFTVMAVNQNLNLGALGLDFLFLIGKETPFKINLGYEGEGGKGFWSNELMLTFGKDF